MEDSVEIQCRPIEVSDAARAAELINLEAREPISSKQMRERLASSTGDAGDVYRVLAVTDGGRAIGYGHMVRHGWLEPGLYWMHITVDPATRHQHVGTQLYERLRAFGAQHGCTTLRGEVREQLPGSLAFAERVGFGIERHIVESTLDLESFDEARFAGVVDRVAAASIRFFTMADAGDTLEARQRLHALERTVARDVPGGSEMSIRPFETFLAEVCDSPRYLADAQVLAADLDQWVGCAETEFEAEGHFMYNGITGVLPAYRGRHIALALKLLAIRSAQAHSVRYLRTNNDSANAPMLAVNRELGYRSEPGYYRMLATLPESASHAGTSA
jgi:GNAT superfamily N-acetyltransferase